MSPLYFRLFVNMWRIDPRQLRHPAQQSKALPMMQSWPQESVVLMLTSKEHPNVPLESIGCWLLKSLGPSHWLTGNWLRWQHMENLWIFTMTEPWNIATTSPIRLPRSWRPLQRNGHRSHLWGNCGRPAPYIKQTQTNLASEKPPCFKASLTMASWVAQRLWYSVLKHTPKPRGFQDSIR